jgi:hypothetical protein
MKVAIFQFSLFGINTYVVYDPAIKECVIIDPGMINREEEKAMTEFIRKNSLIVDSVINTHLHIDHAVGNSFLKKEYDTTVLANDADLPLGERMRQQAQMFGLTGSFQGIEVTQFIKAGDRIKVGDGELEVIEVPGHSRGSVALYDREDGFVIVGDALFQGSIGRTDLPGGDYPTLISSIRNGLLTLPDNTIVYPGHGSPTTIGEEKRFNPYLR